MRIWTSLIVLLSFTSATCFAQITSPMDGPLGASSEYFVGRELGKPLITVNLLNGVTRPGVYHIPIQTTLPQIVAYAGGTTALADTTEIHVRRFAQNKVTNLSYDLNAMMKSDQEFPTLNDKDVMQIREHQGMENTLRWVTLIAGVSTTILSLVLARSVIQNGR